MIVLEEWPGGEMALLQTELVPPLVPGLQHPRQSSSSDHGGSSCPAVADKQLPPETAPTDAH